MNVNKSLILNELKRHFNFKKELEFANFLGVKPQTLASWHSRNVYDIDILYKKCNEITSDWLLTGTGAMLRSAENTVVMHDKKDLLIIADKQKIIDLQNEVIDGLKSEKKRLEIDLALCEASKKSDPTNTNVH